MPHFKVQGPRVGPMPPKYELNRDFCTGHLANKFHYPTFHRSEVIALTKKQTNPETLLKTSTFASLCYTGGKLWKKIQKLFPAPSKHDYCFVMQNY